MSICQPRFLKRLADRAGHDLAWANRTSLKTHWLTLPAELLCRQLNLETGSFSDLERAIERTYHISFSTAAVSKGNVSQSIGNTDTLAGETCRFFRTPLTEKASLSTTLRHAYASYAISSEPLNGGIGITFASLLEDARQANQNSADAHSIASRPAAPFSSSGPRTPLNAVLPASTTLLKTPPTSCCPCSSPCNVDLPAAAHTHRLAPWWPLSAPSPTIALKWRLRRTVRGGSHRGHCHHLPPPAPTARPAPGRHTA